MSLFPLKKHCLFLSLFLFSSLSLSLICFTGCRFVFFFLSFTLLFVLGVNSKRWSSLSFSLVFGEIGNHIIRLSLSLSLSLLRRERFGKPDLPFEYSAAHKKREGSSLRKKSRLARESRKKRWIGCLFSLRHEPQPHRGVGRVKDENAHIRENKSMLPCVRPRGACLQNSFFRCCFNIYTCIFYVKRDLFLINAFVLSTCCCVRIRKSAKGRKM